MNKIYLKRIISIFMILMLLSITAFALAADPVAVKKIILNEESLIIPVKKGANLKATIEPAKATNKKLIWTSSDEQVVTVKNGKITGVSVGTAVITATAEDGNGATVSVTVTIVQPVKKLIIEGERNLAMPPETSWKLMVTAEPADATIKDVVWSSSNTKAVTVDDNGVITAVEKGDAIITATAADGSKVKATVNVKVKDFDLVFTDGKTKSAYYKYGSGLITVTGSVKTGCVRIPDVNTGILAAIGKRVETVDVSVTAVKPGTDVVTFKVNNKMFTFTCFVSPELFPESGLAATAPESEETSELLFMDIPWGTASGEADTKLKEKSKSIKDIKENGDHLRAQVKGSFKFTDYTATNCYLNFSYTADEKDIMTNNALYEADMYFDKEIPLDTLALAIRSAYGLRQGEPTGDNEYSWRQGGTLLTLTKKDRFIILAFTPLNS